MLGPPSTQWYTNSVYVTDVCSQEAIVRRYTPYMGLTTPGLRPRARAKAGQARRQAMDPDTTY
jgi:hypothetical protein